MAVDYSREAEVGQLALQRAAILTRTVFHERIKGIQIKADRSPVTIGDYGAQALIISAIRHAFPADPIVGEEEASALQENAALRSQVWEQVKAARLDDEASENLLGGPVKSEEDMVMKINQGNAPGGDQGRFWTLDPIDGTAGFLRGGQYALCLALIVDGDVKFGAIACPNLPIDASEELPENVGLEVTEDEGRGVLVLATLGKGAYTRLLSRGPLEPARPIKLRPIVEIGDATFVEGVEAGHSAHSEQAKIGKSLGMTRKSLRMDSQAKYAAVARGSTDIYLRLPRSMSYEECIWDHASGDLINREAGAEVTDMYGKRLDFSQGLKLSSNKGIVVCDKSIHKRVLAAVQEVMALEK
ncbi:MAG: hypothetical protein M1814_004752 [Vezdaea aestivalis]|nr:MAG: hypothetical protein M1814_004752 [Vezdaea aestivalis]